MMNLVPFDLNTSNSACVPILCVLGHFQYARKQKFSFCLNYLLSFLFIFSKLNTFDAHLIQDHDDFLTMLHDLSRMGAPMRRVLIGALTNPQVCLKQKMFAC